MKSNLQKNIYIDKTAIVEDGAHIGEGTKIWHFSHIRETAVLGSNCTVGKDVYIDKGVIIGDNVKIQNGVSLYNGIKVEDDVFFGPYSTFTNDLFPRSFSDDWAIVPTVFKKGCSIGANATVLCGNTIGEYSMIAAGSVVTSDIIAHTLVAGNPGSIIGIVCICGNKMKKLSHEYDKVHYYCSKCKFKLMYDVDIVKVVKPSFQDIIVKKSS